MIFWSNNSRILCLGNNTEHTDTLTRELAASVSSLCHGLLSEIHLPVDKKQHEVAGFYHSSVYDIHFGRLIELANQFDGVVMLDQPLETWSHPDAFYNTVRIMKQITVPTQFLDPDHEHRIDYWTDLVKTNRSFCAFPFIELLVDRGNTTVCCRSQKPVVPIQDLADFGTDPNYQAIRERMLRGELVPEHCAACYRLEAMNLPSARQQETVEWANRLGFKSVQDFKSVDRPFYYEVRPSNRCNLQCRMCGPSYSHLIDREYRALKLIDSDRPVSRKFGSGFAIVDFQNLRKLYLAGGEPLMMPETYDFLDHCIQTGQTDFEFIINTNGTKLSQKLLNSIRHFSNLQFIFSIDAHDRLNHYIRWPSDWNTIISNWRSLRKAGHKIIINTTVSIYNIHRLHDLYEFIDREFPGTLTHCQIVESPQHLSPWLFPDSAMVLSSLRSVLTTECARNDQLFAASIEGYIRLMEQKNKIDHDRLKEFYQFNDLLDYNRSTRLRDFVPELEAFRSLVS